MKQTIILGNIITVDEKRPFAKAALVKNGVFAYIGDAEEAKRLAGQRKRRMLRYIQSRSHAPKIIAAMKIIHSIAAKLLIFIQTAKSPDDEQ